MAAARESLRRDLRVADVRQCVRTLKDLALPYASHFGEIALAGSLFLRATLAAPSVVIAHATVTVV